MHDNMKVTLGKMNTAIVRGEEDLSAWSEEELIRGQRRDKNGNWSGRKPKVVPTAVHQELARRRMSEAYAELNDSLVAGARTLRAVIEDDEVEADTRLKAVELLFNRVLGKPTENVQMKMAVRSKFEQAFHDMVVMDHPDELIEGNVVDD